MDDGIERPGPWYARQDADTRPFSASTRAWYKANLFHITVYMHLIILSMVIINV